MPSYATDFTASYDPNLRTSLTQGGPGVDYGQSEGLGLNIDDMLAKAFAYKQKGNEEDWYWKQRQAQENAARQAAALRDAERAQNEERAAARREQMGAANDYAALLQQMQGPIAYKFTDVGTAARAFGREIPARHTAMAAGKGASQYSPGADFQPGYGSFDQFEASSKERLPYSTDYESDNTSSAPATASTKSSTKKK